MKFIRILLPLAVTLFNTGCAMTAAEKNTVLREDEYTACRRMLDAGASSECMKRANQLYPK